MTYVLYGDRGSGSASVELALAEIGAPVELRAIVLDDNAQLTDDYRRINPMGRLPTLVLPDGTIVTESVAIMVWLADRHPEAALLPPAGTAARAAALRWMVLAAAEIYPCVTRSDYPERFSTDPTHAPAIRARARAMGRELLQLIETHAAPDPFILGDTFSIADAYLAIFGQWMGNAEWLPQACPRLAAMTRAVAARPACAPVWARHFG